MESRKHKFQESRAMGSLDQLPSSSGSWEDSPSVPQARRPTPYGHTPGSSSSSGAPARFKQKPMKGPDSESWKRAPFERDPQSAAFGGGGSHMSHFVKRGNL